MGVLSVVSNSAKSAVNDAFKGREAWEIVGMTSTTIIAAFWLYNFIFQEEGIKERWKRAALKLARRIPAVREKIEREIGKLEADFESTAMSRTKGLTYFTDLPKVGLDAKEIVKLVERHVQLGEYDWKNGRVSGCVYRKAEKDLVDLVKDVYALASLTNPLHPDVFPGVCKMEAEVVRMACKLFNGDDNSCGTMTTGGTESILLACKAYRDYARETKGIKNPEMIMPTTAHSAFDKAAQYLKIKIRAVPVDPTTYTVDVKAMRKAINGNTIMLVCSAPNFPYGTMDDVEAVSNLGSERDVPVHVDACLGGFLICFMGKAGYEVPKFGFELAGVCSVSADTHKYGFAPKGSSCVLYRSKKLRHRQYTITTDWPGGIYGSPTVNGSRAGGIIAACWATMVYFGLDGYVEATRRIIETTRFIEQELRKLKGVKVMGKPATSVIALSSEEFNIFRLSEALNNRGWNLNVLQYPSALHICVTHIHTEIGVAKQFVEDVKLEISAILETPSKQVEGMYAVYGTSQAITDRSIVGDITRCFIDSMYYTPSQRSILADSKHK